MRLNLGCSDKHLSGCINVDIVAPCDLIWDLSKDWPWGDSMVEQIIAFDIIEHLPDKIHTMNELWRVLKPGGVVNIIVPTTDGRGAFQDPTHVSWWNRNSFFYFEDKNIHRERFGDAYGIKARFRVYAEEEKLIADKVTKLYLDLEAIK